MQILRILDREFMQPEPALHIAQLHCVRLKHAQPDEAVFLRAHLGRETQLHRPLVLALSIAVMSTVDNHSSLLAMHCAQRTVKFLSARTKDSVAGLRRATSRAATAATAARLPRRCRTLAVAASAIGVGASEIPTIARNSSRVGTGAVTAGVVP